MKRKASAIAVDAPGVNKRQQRMTTSIASYARVTKAIAKPVKDVKDSIAVTEVKSKSIETEVPIARPQQPAPTSSSTKSKRKRAAVTDSDTSDQETSSKAAPLKKRQILEPQPSTPRKQRSVPTPTETPTRGASKLLDAFRLASPSPKSTTKQKQKPVYDTPPTSRPDTPVDQVEDNLPQELEDLIELFSSFLTALNLHYAHNGTSTPADLRTLCPSTTKVWGVRKVTPEDVRQCLGVIGKDAPFFLSGYGSGKVCVELREKRRGGVLGRCVDEELQNELFKAKLATEWRALSGENGDETAENFVRRLKLAEIVKNVSAKKADTLWDKGRKRLEEIRTPLVSMEVKDEQSVPAPANTDTGSRKQSLLDRILAKQTAASLLPNPPTKEELERRAALHRLEELVSILSLLAMGRGRASFPLQQLVLNIQASVRSPLGKEEVLRCVDLLEKEVAPGFVSIVRSGSMVGVVVNTMMKPGTVQLRDSVRRAEEAKV